MTVRTSVLWKMNIHMAKKWPEMVVKRSYIKGHSFPYRLYFLKYEMTEFDQLDSILCGFFVCVCLFWLWHIWSRIVPNRKKYTHTKDKFPTSDFILLLGVMSFYLQIHFWNKTKKIETKIACKYSFFKKTPKGAFTYDVRFLGR